MLPVDLLLRWKRTLRIVLPILLSIDMVHSMYYVAGLYQKRREEWAEEDFAEVKGAVQTMMHGVVQHCQHKDPLLWPSAISQAFGSSSMSKATMQQEPSVSNLVGSLTSDATASAADHGANDIFCQLGIGDAQRDYMIPTAVPGEANTNPTQSCANQEQHGIQKEPVTNNHISLNSLWRVWHKLEWPRIATFAVSSRSQTGTAKSAFPQYPKPPAAAASADATATQPAIDAAAHQSSCTRTSNSAQLMLDRQFTKLVSTVQHSVCDAMDKVPKHTIVQGYPWPCMSVARRSALRWHVAWHGVTWPDVPTASVELQLDDCY